MTGSVDALVSGKRRAPRQAVRLTATVKGVRGTFPAEVHDLSSDGALVGIPVESLTGRPSQPLGPAEQFALLETHFRDTFDLQFDERDVIVETQVVRLLVSPGHEDTVAVGCRFAEALSESQQRRLGLLEEGAGLPPWGAATQRHRLLRAAHPARSVTAMIFDEAAEERGPRHVLPVLAVGRAAVMLRMHPATEEGVRTQLGVGPMDLRLRHGTRELLASSASLAALRYADAPSPGVEVLLVLPRPLPRAVRRLFRRL